MKDRNTMEVLISNYYEKTSQHLFVNEKEDTFMKIITFDYDGKKHVARLKFGNGKSSLYISEQLSDTKWENQKGNSLAIASSYLFNSGEKYHSIPNFKAMREMTAFIKELLVTKYDGTKASTDLIHSIIKEQLQELTPLKKELV
jgi:hypothetical protein